MAEKRRTNPSRRPASRRRRRQPQPRITLTALFRAAQDELRQRQEFREDVSDNGLKKLLFLTLQQRYTLLRWGCYIGLCLLLLVVQDTIMSRVSIFGATTDLAVCGILILAVLEGSEVGSVTALLLSLVYYFTGSSPGAYCIAMITIFGMLASILRQQFWHRSSGSILVCSGGAMLLYEMGVYGAGLFLGLTRWDRFPYFFTTAILSILVMIPLYFLFYKIGLIGGYQWKE